MSEDEWEEMFHEKDARDWLRQLGVSETLATEVVYLMIWAMIELRMHKEEKKKYLYKEN
jgi:hypothetical protein